MSQSLTYPAGGVVALAGGVGAGKFLRGLRRATQPADTGQNTGASGGDAPRLVIVNTGDDIEMHGLRICPDLDSVLYWLTGEADRERGWGRQGESFAVRDALQTSDSTYALDARWFNLGDRDIASHLIRSAALKDGRTLTEATRELSERTFGLLTPLAPMSDDWVTTRLDVRTDEGATLDLHFQEYWVGRRAADTVLAIRYEGASEASPPPGVLDALRSASAIIVCPSNPVASIWPILAVPGYREVLAARRDVVVGISPIVGGAPLRGMADKLMPAVGLEVSALGAASAYAGLIGSWVIDHADRALAPEIESALGLRVGITDTIMANDTKAAELAEFTLDMVR